MSYKDKEEEQEGEEDHVTPSFMDLIWDILGQCGITVGLSLMWTPLSQSLSSVLVLVLVLAAAGHSAQLPVFTASLSAGGNIPGCCRRASRSQLFDRSTLRSCLLLLQLLHQFLLHSYSIARSACQSPPLNPPPRYEVDRVASRIRH